MIPAVIRAGLGVGAGYPHGMAPGTIAQMPGHLRGDMVPGGGNPIGPGYTPAGSMAPSQTASPAAHQAVSGSASQPNQDGVQLYHDQQGGIGVAQADPTGSTNLVPLGNGRYIDLNSGTLQGIPAGSLGSIIRTLQ